MPIIRRSDVETAAPAAKKVDIRDGGRLGVRGLMLRVYPSGLRTFFFTPGRGAKWYRIGRVPALTLAAARARAAEIAAAIERGEDHPSGRKVKAKATTAATFAEFVNASYVPHFRAHHRTDSHLRTLRAALVRFGAGQVENITLPAVRNWRTDRLRGGTKPATVNRDIAALKASLAFAVAEGVLASHPLAGLPRLRVEQENRVRYLTPDEETRLRKALEARQDRMRAARTSGNRWRAARGLPLLPDISNYRFADRLLPMVLVTLNTGLRWGELASLRWNCIVDEVLQVRARTAKSGKSRFIPLNKEAAQTMAAWRDQSFTDADALVFPAADGDELGDVRKSWAAVLADARIVDFKWHDLRHHFASRLAMAGASLAAIRELLGHSDLKMTLRYAHLAPGHLRDAVALL